MRALDVLAPHITDTVDRALRIPGNRWVAPIPWRVSIVTDLFLGSTHYEV